MKKYIPQTIGWWLEQRNYAEKLPGSIFVGEIMRDCCKERKLVQSVYRIQGIGPSPTLAVIELLDKSPHSSESHIMINLKLERHANHYQIKPEEVYERMSKLSLDARYLKAYGFSR